MTWIFVIASIPLSLRAQRSNPVVIASTAKQSRRPCDRGRNTTRLPRRLRLLAMTWIFVIANAVNQSRRPCERRRNTTRLPRRLRLLAMTGIFVIAHIPLSLRAQRSNPVVLASAAKQPRRPCDRRRNTTRLPRRLRILSMTGIFVIAHIPLSLRAQRSNPVVLVSAVAIPQDCRVGFASSQ